MRRIYVLILCILYFGALSGCSNEPTTSSEELSFRRAMYELKYSHDSADIAEVIAMLEELADYEKAAVLLEEINLALSSPFIGTWKGNGLSSTGSRHDMKIVISLNFDYDVLYFTSYNINLRYTKTVSGVKYTGTFSLPKGNTATHDYTWTISDDELVEIDKGTKNKYHRA